MPSDCVLHRGKTEWTGEWSDKSERWSDSVREELGWSKKNDGTFWMTWQGEKIWSPVFLFLVVYITQDIS